MSDVLITAVGLLDSLPNSSRAMLCGAVLAGALCFIQTRLPADYSGLAIAYCKATLLALVLIPSMVYYALGLRFVVVVEELPEIAVAPLPLQWGLLAIWLGGATVAGILDWRSTQRAIPPGPSAPVDPVLSERLEFWRRRLGVRGRVRIATSANEQPSTHGWLRPVISLPRSAGHWPRTVQDAVLLHELDHIRHNHGAWLLFGRWVAALYWPIPWVRQITEQLALTFQQAADARSVEFFGDRMGYSRALTHVAQRIDPLPHEQPAPHQPLLGWQDSASLKHRIDELDSGASRDPCYDRVFWGLAQATLAVFLLTGTTLQEVYIPEEHEIFIPNEFWYVSFGRSSRYEDVKDWASMPPADRRPESVPTGSPP
jgi:hypothetical protein